MASLIVQRKRLNIYMYSARLQFWKSFSMQKYPVAATDKSEKNKWMMLAVTLTGGEWGDKKGEDNCAVVNGSH